MVTKFNVEKACKYYDKETNWIFNSNNSRMSLELILTQMSTKAWK